MNSIQINKKLVSPKKSLIRNYLTLRYDPLEKPLIPHAKVSDFSAIENDPDGLKTQKILEKIIFKQLKNEKNPIVVGLSSGIDSALTLALIRKVFPRKKIISISAFFENGLNESIKAKKIAKNFDSSFKTIKMHSTFRTLPTLVGITGKPRWNNYQHLIVKEAKKLSNVIYFGDGADELFGGYTFRYQKFLQVIKNNDSWQNKTKNYLDCHNRDWVPDQNKLFGKSIKFNWNIIYNYFKPYFSNSANPLTQVLLADFNGKLLLDFIPTNRRTFKFYNMKGFSIFLDKKIINHALHLPLSQKYSSENHLGKLTLRKITSRLGIDHINEKKGFSPELYTDWINNGEKICKNYLDPKESYVIKHELINSQWIEKAFEKINDDADVRYLYKLISVLALEIWFQIFVTKELKENSVLS